MANDFPGINIIAAHAGDWAWWPEAAELASGKPNLYLDLSTGQNRTRRWPIEEFYRPLRHMINMAGWHKILFGSDWPVLKHYLSQADWVKKFAEIPEEVQQAGIRFTEKRDLSHFGRKCRRIAWLGKLVVLTV